MQHEHKKRVMRIADEVRSFYAAGKPFRIYHGSTNSTRILTFKRDETIDVSDLNQVLAVDQKARTALVEANVPMDKLVRETLKHGLVPEVVMEFPGITVGGGIQGGAGESSSFRYGCFNQTCNSFEVILANGRQVQASPQKNADLFYGSAGSFGTLGIITAAKVRLVPAKKYVRLTYLPVTSFAQAVKTLRVATRQNHDYIDGIMFGPDHGVVIVGTMTNKRMGRVRRFTRARDQWYYLHAEAIDTSKQEVTETVLIWDYLFRYDRGGFWVGRYAFELFHKPFNRYTRWLLNPLFHTRKLYEALQASGASQQFIVQDLALPLKNAVKFMEFVDQTQHIYPLWLCPLLPSSKSPFQSNAIKTPLVINIGVWGNHIASRPAFIKANRTIEHKLAELGGKKWYYAHSYYTRTEFWKFYNKHRYDALRQKYHATTLPDIYEKIRVKEAAVVNMKRGALKAMQGRAKLRIQR
jgi:Delta24-sterol reductase